MTILTYDVKAKKDIKVTVDPEKRIRVKLLDSKNVTIAELCEHDYEFDNDYERALDSFLDGGFMYAGGVNYWETSICFHSVRFERDATPVENEDE